MIRCFAAAAAAWLFLAAPASAQDVASNTTAPAAEIELPAAAPESPPITPLENALIEDPNAYRIGPEDLLDIAVWKNPELSRTVPVRPDGKVSLPLVNDIQASGLTPTELRAELISRLSEFIPAPEVAVIVREVHSMKVAVVGSLKNPGRYELKSAATVLEMIAMAQGFTDFADRDRIVILRKVNDEPTRIPFNYRKVARGDEQANLLVEAGDIILVP